MRFCRIHRAKFTKVYTALSCILFVLVATMVSAQVTIVITDVPKTTPPEDTIFICGSFNNWATDSHYMLRKRIDGKYTITLNIDSAFEYKFHRGNWATVETSAENEYTPNRQHGSGDAQTVYLTIANWQDLGGAKPFDIVSFYFFAMVFVGLAASYFLLRIKNKRKARAKAVIRFLSLISVILFGRVILEVVSLPYQYQLGLLADIALLLGPPLWYSMLITADKKGRLSYWHWLPAAAFAVLLVLRLANLSLLAFLADPVAPRLLSWDEMITNGVAMSSFFIYIFLGLRHRKKLTGSSSLTIEETSFYNTVSVAGAMFMLVFLIRLLLTIAPHDPTLLWYHRNLLPGAASLFTFLVCYYVFTFDEIFRVNQPVLRKTDDLEALKAKLHKTMQEQRVYINPHLTLNDLAEIVDIKPHVLSKIINDYQHQNFRDFVNKYRIEEFIHLANQGSSKRFTFLALAFEVGFNSKSTFNVAFKKLMNVTPREYFQSRRGNALSDKDLKSAVL